MNLHGQHSPNSAHSPLGIHYLLEFTGCAKPMLTDVDLVSKELTGAAKKAGATVVETVIHQFNPHGISGVVVIAESHLAIHTWPEHDYAAIDIFTCGEPEIAENIYKQLLESFSPETHSMQLVERRPAVSLSSTH